MTLMWKEFSKGFMILELGGGGGGGGGGLPVSTTLHLVSHFIWLQGKGHSPLTLDDGQLATDIPHNR
jgi:hypothetical protein